MVRSILITVLTIILIVESSTELVANDSDSDRSKENEHVKNEKRITILNIEDLLNLEKSDIFGLGNIHGTNDIPRDMIDDGINSSPLAPGLYII